MYYLNVAAYKFVNLQATLLAALQERLRHQALHDEIKGTLILSEEGINLFLAAIPEKLQQFLEKLCQIPEFSDLEFKYSKSQALPYKQLRVRIKKEIIFMNQPAIKPALQPAPYIDPLQLKQWYDNNQEMIVLDTRNKYEVERGTFANAIHCQIENFSDFPKAVAQLPDALKTKPIVTFCTGGIRCEKAAAYMLSQGFENVWQLQGGILNYFQHCGGEYFAGDCFVFDKRVAVNALLEEIN